MVDILKGDVVVFKATPNSGEMVVLDVKYKHLQYRDASENNPAVKVQYWNAIKQEYDYDTFYYNNLVFVRRE